MSKRIANIEELTLKTATCWLYAGPRDIDGYGNSDPHREAWEAVNGPIPAKMEIHHVCGVKWCVRPDHLLLVSGLEHRMIHLRSKSWTGGKLSVPDADGEEMIFPIDMATEVASYQRFCLESALRVANGYRSRAAILLGLSYRSFRHLAKKLGISQQG